MLVPAGEQRNTEAEKAAIKETNARWTLKVGSKLRYRPDATPLPQTAVPGL
ncbi:MAG: hypothetical protein AAF183_21305 [Pseudomonadota bacterium]